MKVLGRVLVFRRIAASHLPAYHALPQVNPFVSQFYAFPAHACGPFHVLNLIQVCALFHRDSSIFVQSKRKHHLTIHLANLNQVPYSSHFR
jgi:hypothetical protein